MAEQRLGLGFGFDVHPSAKDRPLFLAGVSFPGEPGLSGHSDGDVVCHAVGDAILGAAALGDIGEHFPETDPAVAGIAGMDLLAQAVALIRERGFATSSADVTVIAQRPSIAPAREEMRRALAAALDLSVERVSVKATRPEGLGLSGDGVGCMALVALSFG